MLKLGSELRSFLKALQADSLTPYLVGGAVIDNLVDRQIKDWDIEVHGCSLEQLEAIVRHQGLPANLVGARFGVLVTTMDGIDFDLSVPRRENKVGKGHKGFEISFDPNMSVEDAARRRDLTINAMMVNLLTEELVDLFDGLQDFEAGCLRAVDHGTFAEDPLRVLRIMQLLPRKGKFVAESTKELCRSLSSTFPELTGNTVAKEFEKLLFKAAKPSIGLEFLREVDWLKWFPALAGLVGCPQNLDHHPEGDVWIHTLMVVDEAAKLRNEIVDEKVRFAFMLAALLHDIGKPSTTAVDLTAHGHDKAGEELVGDALSVMGIEDNSIRSLVRKLVRNHMQPHALIRNGAKAPAWRRLHGKVDLTLVNMLAIADHAGRKGHNMKEAIDATLPAFKMANEIGTQPIKPLVTGKDLISLGFNPGPEMGNILRELFELQLDGSTREELLASLR